MLWKEMKDIEDCSVCPLYEAELCTGGVISGYGGDPIEPPCCLFNDDTDLDEYVQESYKYEYFREKREDEQIKKEKEKAEKNKITQKKKRISKNYTLAENIQIKKIKKQIKYNEKLISYAKAVSFTNTFFGYEKKENLEKESSLEKENKELLIKIEELNTIKKNKMKELRKKNWEI